MEIEGTTAANFLLHRLPVHAGFRIRPEIRLAPKDLLFLPLGDGDVIAASKGVEVLQHFARLVVRQRVDPTM